MNFGVAQSSTIGLGDRHKKLKAMARGEDAHAGEEESKDSAGPAEELMANQ